MRTMRLLALLLFPVVAVLFVSFGARPAAGTAEPGSQPIPARALSPLAADTTLTAVEDTYVSEGSPTTNYGSEDYMSVARSEFTQESFALLRFSLSSIPAGSTIHSASLQLYLTSGGSSAKTLDIYRATEAWSFSSVTWNSRPNTTCCYGSTSVGTTSGLYYAWDITSLVDGWVNGSYANNGLAVRGPSGSSWFKSFATLSTSNQPRLVINYTAPTPTPAPTSTGTVTPTPTPTATPRTGAIGDRVWHDADHDGTRDSGESGIQDVGLNLVQDGVVLDTDTTNSGGFYGFSDLSAGTYEISIDPWTLPGGYELTDGTEPRTVVLGAGEYNYDVDFGYALPPTPTPTATPVPDIEAYDIEVTQAVQNLNSWVRLVAGKRTFVRFYARTRPSSGYSSYWTTAALHVDNGFSDTWLMPINPGGGIRIGRYMARTTRDGAFLFELPRAYRDGTVSMTAYVNPDASIASSPRTVTETDYTNNDYSVSVTYEDVPPLNLTVYRVGYQKDGAEYWPATDHVNKLVSWLRAAYPIDNLNYLVRSMMWGSEANVSTDSDGKTKLSNPSCGSVHSSLSLVARGSALTGGGPDRAYGLVSDALAFMRGCSPTPGNSASGPAGAGTFGWDFDGSYADWYGGHEIGHSLGRPHAPFCGADGSAYYPYWYGHIGPYTGPGSPLGWRDELYGFDVRDQSIYPDTWTDVMSYCDREWVSNFTYEHLMDTIQSHGTSTSAAATVAATVDRLSVAGTIDQATGDVQLEPIFVLPDSEELEPRVPGDYAIVLRDGSGGELARYAFTPVEIHSGPPSPDASGENEIALLSFSERVPHVAGTERIDIEGPGGALLASVSAGGSAPTVAITAPAAGATLTGDPVTIAWNANDSDGDPLTYMVQYTADGGTTWQTVSFPTTETSTAVDSDTLQAAAPGRFRVLASDGVHTTIAESGDVTMPNHVPELNIVSPADDVTVAISQTVNFEVEAYDADIGSMPDDQLEWSSDRDGVLGNGRQLSVADLSVGEHVVTVTADDGNGGTTTASVTVTVVDALDKLPAVPDALDAGPRVLQVALSNGQTEDQINVINLNGKNVIGWNASASQPWVSFSAASGTTPDEVTVSVDGAGLGPGRHTATVTLTSPDVPNDQVTVEVEAVRLYRTQLPLVSRQ